MSHSWTSVNNVTFNFDGGMEGDLTIRNHKTNEEMVIRAQDVVDLVAFYYVRPRRMSAMEAGSADQVFGVD